MTTNDNETGFHEEPPEGGARENAADASHGSVPSESVPSGPVHSEAFPPTEPPDDVYVARPAWSDKDRFLLRDASRSSVWADMALLVAGLVGFEVLSSIVVLGVVGFDDSEDFQAIVNHTLLVPMLLVRAVWSFLLVGLILRCRGQRAKSVGISTERWGMDALIGIGATPVVYGLIWLAMMVLWLIKPALLEQMSENAELLTDLLPKLSIASFFGLSVAVALYEELIFRGFLIARLRRGTGSWVLAVLISTAIFTGLHAFDQKPVALVAVAILGLSFSILTIWRRSILPAIVTHALFDFTQFLALYMTRGDNWN